MIRTALNTNIAKNDDEAVTYLRGKGLSRKVARGAVAKSVEEEGGAGTLWELVQGISAHARSIPHRDQRATLERKAGQLLQLAA